ncbi:hypothetical protein Trydic_g12585 [Trypoxylus dichotomus]
MKTKLAFSKSTAVAGKIFHIVPVQLDGNENGNSNANEKKVKSCDTSVPAQYIFENENEKRTANDNGKIGQISIFSFSGPIA